MNLRLYRGSKSTVIGLWKKALWLLWLFVMLSLAPFSFAFNVPNPIGSETLGELVLKVSQEVTKFALVVAPLFIIFAGFRFLMASYQGNQAGLTNAKTMFWWTLVGIAIVVGARVIAGALVNLARGL